MAIEQKQESKTEIIRQNYDYTFLSDLLEMIRGSCGIIHSDKNLHRLFTAVVNYVNLQLPDFEGEVDGFDIAITLKK